MFGTLGGPELFLILVVALIVFGPRKLPEIGKSIGRMMAEFRKASNDFRRTIEDEVEAEKLREATRIDVPSWSSTGSTAPEPAALPPAPDAAQAASGTDVGPHPSPASSPTENTLRELTPATGAGSQGSAEPAPDETSETPPADTVSRGALVDERK
jgi:Tat protein translocase TatB subunit